MLAQTFSNRHQGGLELVTNGVRSDLGVYSTIIHKHEVERDLKLELEFNSKARVPEDFVPTKDNWNPTIACGLTYAFDPIADKPKLREVSTRDSHPILGVLEHRLIRINNNKNRERFAFRCPYPYSKPNVLHRLRLDAVRHVYEFLLGRKNSFTTIREKSAKLIRRALVELRKGNSGSLANLLSRRFKLIDDYIGLQHLKDKEVVKNFSKGYFTEDAAFSYLPTNPVFDAEDDTDENWMRFRLGMFDRKEPQSETDASTTALAGLVSYELRRAARFLESTLSGTKHVQPLRAAPTRLVDQTREADLVVDERYETEINACLRKIGLPYTISVHRNSDPILGNIQTFRLYDERLKTTVALSDVGFGISQILPIIRAGIVAKFGERISKPAPRFASRGRRQNLILVEQPEIHIHPKLQAELAEFFVETVRDQLVDPEPQQSPPAEGSQPKTGELQWIIETHSEALLLRLLKLIRSGSIKPSDVAINYIDIDHSSECASVTNIEVNERGEFITDWPNGFFEERINELFD
jgi:AAA ATPase domain/Protein of unknown function (DUF3696)